MPITAVYDREADGLYVRLTDSTRVRAVEIDDTTYVDVDADGVAVGIEFLYPATRLNVTDAASRFGFEQQTPAILAAIARSGAPVPTITGGSHVATMSIPTVAVEGTVAAAYEASSTSESVVDEKFIRIGA